MCSAKLDKLLYLFLVVGKGPPAFNSALCSNLRPIVPYSFHMYLKSIGLR